MFEKEAEKAGNEKIRENNQLARCARKSYKDGFKDGAEFGYQKGVQKLDKKWHDLRKNPKDVPKYNSTVLDENGDKITYRGGDAWTVYSEYYEKDIDAEQPKAWCEIPTFNDKE